MPSVKIADPFPTELLEKVVRRVAQERLETPDDVDELVQETLTRVLEARDRLDSRVLGSYASMTAINLLASHRRKERVERRGRPKVIDLSEAPDPEVEAIRSEDKKALIRALGQLPESDRRLLLEHEVNGVPIASLARRNQATGGALTAKLHRVRARLRVEYLFASQNMSPPTNGCRAVLESLSAGDVRRQRRLEAHSHLLACDTCSSMAPFLVEGKRPLPLLLPLLAFKKLVALFHAHPVPATSGVAVAGCAVALALVLQGGGHPPPPAPATPALTIAGKAGFPSRVHHLDAFIGAPVHARGLQVISVPANEGFWAGTGLRHRVWVQLVGQGESPVRVKPKDLVRFRGTVVAQGPRFPAEMRLTKAEGARRLRRQDAHISVSPKRISVAPEGRKKG